MCRAALESALEEGLAHTISPDEETPSLDEMMRIAGEEGLLPTLVAEPRLKRKWRPVTGTPLHEADRIRIAGNFIMHQFARYPDEDGQIADAFEAIRALTIVLRALFPPPAAA